MSTYPATSTFKSRSIPSLGLKRPSRRYPPRFVTVSGTTPLNSWPSWRIPPTRTRPLSWASLLANPTRRRLARRLLRLPLLRRLKLRRLRLPRNGRRRPRRPSVQQYR
ncbi:MAG: hypothetical protein [Microviridae sp.]|nr:MAG: hypothetical protein [Microviridae sp.]